MSNVHDPRGAYLGGTSFPRFVGGQPRTAGSTVENLRKLKGSVRTRFAILPLSAYTLVTGLIKSVRAHLIPGMCGILSVQDMTLDTAVLAFSLSRSFWKRLVSAAAIPYVEIRTSTLRAGSIFLISGPLDP